MQTRPIVTLQVGSCLEEERKEIGIKGDFRLEAVCKKREKIRSLGTGTRTLTSNVHTQLLEGNAMSSVPGEGAAMEHPGAGVGDGILVAVHHSHAILQVVSHLHILDDVVVEVDLESWERKRVRQMETYKQTERQMGRQADR